MSPAPPSPAPLPPELLRRVLEMADRFESAWLAGAPLAIEDHLVQAPPAARPELLRQLLRIERAQRQQQGRPLMTDEARQRFAPFGPWAAAVVADLALEDSSALLTLDIISGPEAGRSFQLAGHSTWTIGRGPAGVNLAIERDPGLSRIHFLLEYNPPHARLTDLRSYNGTFVNGQRQAQADLHNDDTIPRA